MTGENADGYCWCEIYLHLSENIDCPGIGLINQLKLKPPGRHNEMENYQCYQRLLLLILLLPWLAPPWNTFSDGTR